VKNSVSITRLRSYTLPDWVTIPATICEAALATSAVSSFFDPVSIGERKYVDGPLIDSNPADQVEDEAVNIWAPDSGHVKPLVKCFLSIGTGIPGKKALDDSVAKPLSKRLMAMTTEIERTAENFMRRWAEQHDLKRYFRFNVNHGLQDVGLAEYKEQGRVEAVTHEYLHRLDIRYLVRECIWHLQQRQSVDNVDFT
jgi:predicted acylesterase/phospholipase RssA